MGFIIELLAGVVIPATFVYGVYKNHQTINSTEKALDILERDIQKLEAGLQEPAISDDVELVLELLRSDDAGWTRSKLSYKHADLGIDLKMDWDGLSLRWLLTIEDDQKYAEPLWLNKIEEQAIAKETKAFSDRAENRRREAIAAALAKRIVDRGEVRSVLGGTGVSGVTSSCNDYTPVVQPESTGVLEYTGDKIVKIGEGEAVELSPSLRDRYFYDVEKQQHRLYKAGKLVAYQYA